MNKPATQDDIDRTLREWDRNDPANWIIPILFVSALVSWAFAVVTHTRISALESRQSAPAVGVKP